MTADVVGVIVELVRCPFQLVERKDNAYDLKSVTV